MTVAPCDVRGRLVGPAVDGTAGFVPRSNHPGALAGAARRAYGLTLTFGNAASRLWHRLLRRDGERHGLIRVRPA